MEEGIGLLLEFARFLGVPEVVVRGEDSLGADGFRRGVIQRAYPFISRRLRPSETAVTTHGIRIHAYMRSTRKQQRANQEGIKRESRGSGASSGRSRVCHYIDRILPYMDTITSVC